MASGLVCARHSSTSARLSLAPISKSCAADDEATGTERDDECGVMGGDGREEGVDIHGPLVAFYSARASRNRKSNMALFNGVQGEIQGHGRPLWATRNDSLEISYIVCIYKTSVISGDKDTFPPILSRLSLSKRNPSSSLALTCLDHTQTTSP